MSPYTFVGFLAVAVMGYLIGRRRSYWKGFAIGQAQGYHWGRMLKDSNNEVQRVCARIEPVDWPRDDAGSRPEAV